MSAPTMTRHTLAPLAARRLLHGITAWGLALALPAFAQGQEIEAAPPAEIPTPVKVIKELTVEGLVTQVLEKGWEIIYPAPLAKVAGVPTGARAKELIAQRGSSLDDMGRSVQVILDPAADPKAPKPLHLFFSAGKKTGNLQETFEFRAGPGGELELALATRLETDEKGRVVRGSGVPPRPDIKAPEVQERFRRELDFWLKGKGRRFPAGQAAP